MTESNRQEKPVNPNEKLRALLPDIKEEVTKMLDRLAREKKLDFHDVEHTQKVVDRYRSVVTKFKEYGLEVGTEREIILGEIGAMFHDVVQDFDVEEKQEEFNGVMFVKKRRKRLAGVNELSSAYSAIAFLNEKYYGLLSDQDEKFLIKQISTTVPKFIEGEGVTQINLKPDSSLVDRALAMADLGTSGMEPEKFVSDSDKLFREDNLDVAYAVDYMNEGGYLDSTRQEYFRSRMLSWCQVQVFFPKERKMKLEKELDFLGNKKDQFILEVFPGFQKAEELMQKAVENRQEMTFVKLAQDMGYVFK